MNTTLRHPLTELPRNRTLRIDDGQSHVIDVFDGQVWLTQDGDPRDVILEAGDSFSFDGSGLTLVQALRDARLLVSEPAARRRGGGAVRARLCTCRVGAASRAAARGCVAVVHA